MDQRVLEVCYFAPFITEFADFFSSDMLDKSQINWAVCLITQTLITVFVVIVSLLQAVT